LECDNKTAMTPLERQACINARKALRAKDPTDFAKTHGFDKDKLVLRLIEILPYLTTSAGIADAEKKAIDAINADNF